MPVDLRKMVNNLTAFFDFTGKTVLHAGAGGGALIDYAPLAGKIYAADTDAAALENLKNKTAGLSYNGKVVFINEDIRKINTICDCTGSTGKGIIIKNNAY
jgi:predicted RNA methylase